MHLGPEASPRFDTSWHQLARLTLELRVAAASQLGRLRPEIGRSVRQTASPSEHRPASRGGALHAAKSPVAARLPQTWARSLEPPTYVPRPRCAVAAPPAYQKPARLRSKHVQPKRNPPHISGRDRSKLGGNRPQVMRAVATPSWVEVSSSVSRPNRVRGKSGGPRRQHWGSFARTIMRREPDAEQAGTSRIGKSTMSCTAQHTEVWSAWAVSRTRRAAPQTHPRPPLLFEAHAGRSSTGTMTRADVASGRGVVWCRIAWHSSEAFMDRVSFLRGTRPKSHGYEPLRQ